MADEQEVDPLFAEMQRNAARQVGMAGDVDPQTAARAADLGDTFGVPPTYIARDLKGYEARQRAELSSNVVRLDPAALQYVNSHPMAASVSQNDWDKLHELSDAHNKLVAQTNRPWWEIVPRGLASGATVGLGQQISAIGRVVGSDTLAGVSQRIQKAWEEGVPLTKEDQESLTNMVSEGLGQVLSLLPAGMLGGLPGAAAAGGLQAAETETEKAQAAGSGTVLPALGGFAIGAATMSLPLGQLQKIGATKELGPEVVNWVAQRLREAGVTGLTFAGASEMQALLTSYLEQQTFDPHAEYHADTNRMMANFIGGAILGPAFGMIKPFVDAGKPIPGGVHPIADMMLMLKTKADNEALDNAFKAAAATETKELSPELFSKYMGYHPRAVIGIDGNAVQELYGSKPPGPGDGILGDIVPDIAIQLQNAAKDGGDIQVPLKDWYKVDPEIDKKLHDFRRVDPSGLTLDDAKNFFAAPGTEDDSGPPVMKAETPSLGAMARSGQPVLDSVRAHMGLDKILPVPVEQTYDFTPGPGIMPKSVPLDGAPAVSRRMLSGDYSVLKEVRSADMLAMVDPSHLQGIPKTLYKFFGDRLSKIAGDVPVQVVTEQEMTRIYRDIFHIGGYSPGFYWRGAGRLGQGPRIVMTEGIVSGRLGQDYAAHVIIHEMAHAATVRAIDADPQLSRDLLALRKETREWLQKNDPEAFDNPGIAYAFKDSKGMEYIAQAYSEGDFQNQLARIPVSESLAKALGHPSAKNIWDLARNLIKRALEKVFGRQLPPTVLDEMFTLGERFEAAADARKPELRPLDDKVTGPTDDLPSPEARKLFQDQKALGYSRDHWNRIKDQIEKKSAEDNQFQRDQALKDARTRQTQAWKDNSAAMRPEAEATVYGRPAVRADRFLRLGILDGGKVTRQRLDGSALDPAVKDKLSEEWYNPKKGLKPNDIAGILGYRSGDAMISDLALMKAQMDKEGLTHDAFVKSRVDQLVDQRMRSKYGSPEQQALEDAKDHIVTDGTFDLLHEDTLRLATKLGFKAPFTKDQVKAMAKDDFDNQKAGLVKADRQADNTGRLGRKIEDAENKRDVEAVMKLAQQREASYWKTIYAREYEKLLDGKFQRVADTHRKIEVPAFKGEEPAAFHDVIQLLLGDVQYPINRKYEDVKNEFLAKDYKDFKDFAEYMEGRGVPVAIPDWILKGEHQKPFDDLTVGEARSLMETIIGLDKAGREMFKVSTEEGMVDIKGALETAREELAKQYDIKGRTGSGGKSGTLGEISKTFTHYIVASRVMERILDRIDRGNPLGPMNQFVNRPVTEGMNRFESFKREFGRRFRALGPPEDLNKTIDAPFKIPSTGGDFISFNRKNLITIMLNMGTTENWNKFNKGWKVDPDAMELWVKQHATEADWKWVNGVWRIFDDMKVELDKSYRRTTGTPPGTKEFRDVVTQYGTFKGGYYPLVHDEIENGKGSRTNTYGVGDGPTFFQSNIPNPHAKQVTGAEYPVSMNLDFLPGKFEQIAFDATMREPLDAAKKFLNYKPFRQDIKNRLGIEVDKAIDSWFHDVSHAADYNTAAAVQGDRVSQFFRQNVIGYLVGLNPITVAKHGPTALFLSLRQEPRYMLKAYASLFKANPETGDSMWKWISSVSEEIQRRDRYWQETFGGTYKDWSQSTIRDHIIQWGAKPVAFSDMLSAKPLWLAAYMHAIDDGKDFGEARFEADRAVRFAHGSTAISNLPEIARQRGIQSWFTSLYGFFGTVLQNRLEVAYKMNDMYRLGREGDLKGAAKIMPLFAADVFAYIIAPTMVEEWATGLTTDDRRGWGQHAAWATAAGLANSFIGFRDLTHMLEYGMNDAGGLLSSAVKPFTRSFHDLSRPHPMSAQHAGDLIEDLIGLTSLRYGTPHEVGNLAKYGWNTMVANKENPRTGLFENWDAFGDLGQGLARGTQKKTVRK